MPELPEMETYRRLLAERVVDKTITAVQVNRAKSINVEPEAFIADVLHTRILFIERRAKHMLFHLDNGKRLLLHLMLGGWMFFGTEQEKPDRTTQIVLSFGEEHLYFIGLRLGYLHLLTAKEAKEKMAELGPEPLQPDFTPEKFAKMAAAKRGTLKTALVDQSFIAGIGNCYADEICYDAGVLPHAKWPDLEPQTVERLYRSIGTVLREAMAHGGYIEFPTYAGDLLTGGYNDRCKVYDRGGETCYRCGAPVVQEELSGRKLFYCAGCQHGR